MRYILLNVVVLALVLVPVYIGARPMLTRAMLLTIISTLVLTALFDPLIIWAGIVDYNTQHILGPRFFSAPIEDFMYAVVAAILGPVLWRWHENRSR